MATADFAHLSLTKLQAKEAELLLAAQAHVATPVQEARQRRFSLIRDFESQETYKASTTKALTEEGLSEAARSDFRELLSSANATMDSSTEGLLKLESLGSPLAAAHTSW